MFFRLVLLCFIFADVSYASAQVCVTKECNEAGKKFDENLIRKIFRHGFSVLSARKFAGKISISFKGCTNENFVWKIF